MGKSLNEKAKIRLISQISQKVEKQREVVRLTFNALDAFYLGNRTQGTHRFSGLEFFRFEWSGFPQYSFLLKGYNKEERKLDKLCKLLFKLS